MRFEQFQRLTRQMFATVDEKGCPVPRYEQAAGDIPPLVLAYVGDSFFNLFVRTSLLRFEQNKVRVLHDYGARIVSATWQAQALRELEPLLTEAEAEVVRRGRNAKSTVPKSASVGDYRSSTGFEALLGFLYLTGEQGRLEELCRLAFDIISRKLANDSREKGK